MFPMNILHIYRNNLYWDATLKSKYLRISVCIKRTVWSILDYNFNAAFETGNFDLNAAFNIEILISRIKI